MIELKKYSGHIRNHKALCEELGVDIREINIGKAVLQHFEDIGHDPSVTDVTYENSQARERTQILMDIANQEGAIVIGTGDLSELALGWATYNGDHMSMYSVNGGVPKTMVRLLVEWISEQGEHLLGSGNQPDCEWKAIRDILKDVLDTPVSPELLPASGDDIAQKTEDLVGPYELHDFYLYYILRFGFAPNKIYRLAKEAFAGMYDEQGFCRWYCGMPDSGITCRNRRTCI